MKLSNTPIKIGSKTVNNRVTFAPTVKFDWTDTSGIAIPRFARHYEERAAGGAGLIVVEATCVAPEGRLAPSQLGLWDDCQIAGHRAITEACHRYGTVMLVQLHHGGYNTHPECGAPAGPSAIEDWSGYGKTVSTTALTLGELGILRQKFIDAAIRAKKAGFDGVQLHACHAYLLNDFVSPAANRRTDAYGGSLENRVRLACEIIRGIKDTCGGDFVVSMRTTAAEPTIAEACAIADAYADAGADYLQVSSGVALVEPDALGCPQNLPYSPLVWAGSRLHEHMAGRVPVSVVNGILTPELANFILENGLADTVDSARALLADPKWAKAVTEGGSYVACKNCKFCFWSPFLPHRCPAVAERHITDPDCVDFAR